MTCSWQKIFAFSAGQIDSSRSRESKLYLDRLHLHHFSPSPIQIFFVFSVDLALPEDGHFSVDLALPEDGQQE